MQLELITNCIEIRWETRL